MFEKSLQDLIKGIRNHKRDQSTYISKAMVEIKKELRSTDKHLKYMAVQKITYLQMLGVDVGFASFHIIEVMSATRFMHRRAAMLAASQVFDANTEVVLLTTNLIKKDLQATNMYESGVVLNCLSNIATRELARDLVEDVASMLNNSRPFIRKKAVLALYKLYVRYPQGLPQTFDRLRLRLEDSDMSVVSCTVNVICELSRKNPRNFLALAPQLFQLLTTSSNNWMLIKIVKLMSALLPEEPRLARKLLEPLAKVVESTQAKSLLYECISAITQALPYTARPDGSQPKVVPGIVSLCASKLRDFVKDPDQNLKYLGLVGLVNLMRSHPRVVAEHKEMVLQCLMDDDVTVRMRALELLTGMVTKRNLIDIVQKLLLHVETAEGAYRDELIDKIIYVCSRDKYAFLSNFAWYVSILVQLAHIHGAPRGRLIREQLIDVAVRVPDVRPFAARAMAGLLLNRRLALRNMQTPLETEDDGVAHILFAASWIACEYASLLDVGLDEDDSSSQQHYGSPEKFKEMAAVMLSEESKDLASFVQAAFVHNVLKLIAASAKTELESGSATTSSSVGQLATYIGQLLEPFASSEHIVVQERAVQALELLVALSLYDRTVPILSLKSGKNSGKKRGSTALGAEDVDLLGDALENVEITAAYSSSSAEIPNGVEEPELSQASSISAPEREKALLMLELFDEELMPVNVRAQEKVRLPADFDLETPFAFMASGFEESAIDRTLDAQYTAGGGALRISFREPIPYSSSGSGAYSYDSDNGSEAESESSYMLSVTSSSHRKSSKKSSKHKKSSSRKEHSGSTTARVNDPFYIKSTSAHDGDLASDDLPDVPIVHLPAGSLEAEAGSATTINQLFSQSLRESRGANAVMMEDAMPEGALASDDEDSAGKRNRRNTVQDEESMTLADINLVMSENGDTYAATSDTFPVKSEDGNKESKSSRKKSSSKKSSRDASRAEDGSKKHHKSKDKKHKKHKKSSSSSSSKHQEPLLAL